MQGYLVGGSACTADFLDVAVVACAAVLPGSTHCQALEDGVGGMSWRATMPDWATSVTFSPSQFKTCTVSADEAQNGVPTVADGVELGWSVGGTILMVAAMMFIRKALP